MPRIDAERILALFAQLGEKLARQATLCLIGSTPGIASGQPSRQTADIDVWHPASDYDAGDLARACRELGILYDPRGEIEPYMVYIQVIRPGIVRLPIGFDHETIGRFGELTIVMPPPDVLVAAKLVRGSDLDLQDVVWWIRQRRLELGEIEAAIRSLPDPRDREAASENITFVRLIKGDA